MQLGWFAHPLFSAQGNYPAVMIETVNANSARANLPLSRLPAFSADEVAYVRGTSDFMGLNYYSSGFAEPTNRFDGVTTPSRDADQNIQGRTNEYWPMAASTWLRSIPQGLRELLKYVYFEFFFPEHKYKEIIIFSWIKNSYGNPEVVITENGWSDRGEMEDDGRIAYLNGHVQAVVDANVRDGCNVTGYTYWSVIDNFEWLMGYS